MGEISFSIRLKAWYKSMLKHCGLLKTKHVSENGRMVDGLSSGDTIILGKEDEGVFFTGKVHGSVGISFLIGGDLDAFEIERNGHYLHPELMAKGMCGGDEEELTYYLRPKKRGSFVVNLIEDFRGEERELATRIIIVQ